MTDDTRFHDAQTLLHEVFGHTSFKGAQWHVIKAMLQGKRILHIAPTAAGKSLCWQVGFEGGVRQST